nr:MAG TPA: hypothetical protein [Bacteriophage sp.]
MGIDFREWALSCSLSFVSTSFHITFIIHSRAATQRSGFFCTLKLFISYFRFNGTSPPKW